MGLPLNSTVGLCRKPAPKIKHQIVDKAQYVPKRLTIVQMDNPLKPILAGLEAKLGAFEQRARARQTLLEKVRAALPAPENEHVISAAYEKDQLVIAADTAVWCDRLRYCQDTLLAGLAATGERSVTKLKVRVGQLHPGAADETSQFKP